MPSVATNTAGFMSISGSVGDKCVNNKQDVVTVQVLLNRVRRRLGTPNEHLVTDGIVGAKTTQAIKEFQTKFLKDLKIADGKVDPNQPTILRLNISAGPLPPLNDGVSYQEGHGRGFGHA